MATRSGLPRRTSSSLGRAGRGRSDARRQRCARAVSHRRAECRAYGIDLRERDLPQETGQQHALNFTKGCYIGQEIVERIRSRGNVHRMFIGFEVQGDPSASGREPRSAPTTRMWVRLPARRAFHFPSGERTLALGYVRREVAPPGATVQIGEQSATVQTLPFSE